MVNHLLMAIVNRLTPLIVRRAGPRAAVLSAYSAAPLDHAQVAGWLDDLRLFATGWIGGLVFFGTLFG
jgi:hypothetical protein